MVGGKLCYVDFPLKDSSLWYPSADEIPLHVFHCHGMITKVTYKDPAVYASSITLDSGFFVAIMSKLT